jgi:hypothetical protein
MTIRSALGIGFDAWWEMRYLSLLQYFFLASRHDFSRAANAPIWIPALAAAELQIVEKQEPQGLKPDIILLLFRHD